MKGNGTKPKSILCRHLHRRDAKCPKQVIEDQAIVKDQAVIPSVIKAPTTTILETEMEGRRAAYAKYHLLGKGETGAPTCANRYYI